MTGQNDEGASEPQLWEADVDTALARIENLAGAVGRVRRALRASLDAADALAGHVEAIDCCLTPRAADFVRGNRAFGISEDEAVAEALASIDERTRKIRRLLGEERQQ